VLENFEETTGGEILEFFFGNITIPEILIQELLYFNFNKKTTKEDKRVKIKRKRFESH
jgi:hypothetical protein